MTRKQLATLILVISIVDGFMIGALISATTSPTIGVPIGVAAALLPWVLLAGLGPMIWRLMGLHQVESQFPLRSPEVFGKNARIISLAVRQPWLGVNNCVEVASDDDDLHLRLALPGPASRRGVSIPWAAVASIKPGRSTARLDISGLPPYWVPMKLVSRELSIRAVDVPDPASTTGG
jgi:hypothetical protein